MESIDTNKIRESGQDIITLTKELNEEINVFFTRISNMSTKTLEWVGASSDDFIRRSNLEKTQYIKIVNSLNKYGKLLNDAADSYDSAINKLR